MFRWCLAVQAVLLIASSGIGCRLDFQSLVRRDAGPEEDAGTIDASIDASVDAGLPPETDSGMSEGGTDAGPPSCPADSCDDDGDLAAVCAGTADDYTCMCSPGFTATGHVCAARFFEAYAKAPNSTASFEFGFSVAVSDDGNTIAIGSRTEASNSNEINGNDDNTDAPGAGAVFVFVRSGGTWTQEAYIKASNAEGNDNFGVSLALSSDGSTLAVGAHGEDSDGAIDSEAPFDHGAENALGSGAVYVFTRSGSTWTQQAYVKASNPGAGDSLGYSVSLSPDGDRLVVGAYLEDGQHTGVHTPAAPTDPDNGSFDNSGAAYVFARSGTTWTQEAYLKAANTGPGDFFGYSVAIAGNGDTIAVGAYQERSGATMIGGDDTDDSTMGAGAVYVFVREGPMWSQQAYIKASNTDPNDFFGYALSLSADGDTLAVGAHGEASNATGVGGGQSDDSLAAAGAAYIFDRSGDTWAQQAYIKASNTGAGDWFTFSIALADDGNTLAVGAFFEDSNATGLDDAAPFDHGSDDGAHDNSGAAYVYTRSGGTWTQRAYIKAPNTGENDFFGTSVALSQQGGTLVIGAPGEASAATVFDGDDTDDSAPSAGAVYIY